MCIEKEDESWEVSSMLKIGYKLHMKRLGMESAVDHISFRFVWP
jgi:hypothetical protein